MRQWLSTKAASWSERLGSVAPFHLALAALVWALVLLFISAVVEVFDYTYQGRQLGYAITLNWSIGFTLVAPFFYYFLLLAYQEANTLPNKLAQANMLRRPDGELHPGGASVVASRWTTVRRRAASWWLVITLIGLVESLWEWWKYSGGPLIKGYQPREDEFDWSVKFLGAEPPENLLNAGFSLMVFLQQAILISMIGFLLSMALAFAVFIRDLRHPGRAARLFPTVTYEPDDERRGFQVFSRFFQYFLLAGVCLYAHFLLSRLWNVYLHSADAAGKSLWDFIKTLVLEGVRRAAEWRERPDQLLNRIVELLDDLGALDFSGLFVSFGAVLLFSITVTLLAVILRDAAQSARQELLNSGIRGRAKDRLEKMKLWPMRYPGLNTLASLGFLALTAMVAYRVALLFLGIAGALAFTSALKEFLRR